MFQEKELSKHEQARKPVRDSSQVSAAALRGRGKGTAALLGAVAGRSTQKLKVTNPSGYGSFGSGHSLRRGPE